MSKFIKILLFAHNDAFVEEIEISIGSIGTVYTYISAERFELLFEFHGFLVGQVGYLIDETVERVNRIPWSTFHRTKGGGFFFPNVGMQVARIYVRDAV